MPNTESTQAKQVEQPPADAAKAAAKAEKSAAKAAAKAEKEAAKAAAKAEREAEAAAAQATLATKVQNVMEDPFGYLARCESTYRTERKWTRVRELEAGIEGKEVWVRGRLQESRCKGKIGFLVLREQFSTVQCVVSLPEGADYGTKMIKWAGSLPLESVVDVYGKVVKPPVEITGASQQVELHVSKIHCVSKAANELPFQLKDANRPEDASDENAITVQQEVRLDNRVLDLRTYAMQGVMRVSSQVCALFREYLSSQGFTEIHTPKLVGGTSEGGANVFRLEYFGRPACLAQSPQLYKQMAVMSDLDRVFEVAPVFRAENSNTHRHLCEFTGLDMEMAFKEHYFEVLEVVEGMFKYIFKGLNERCQAEIAVIRKQWPSEPFEWKDDVLRLDFTEGVQMLRDAGVEGVPDDLEGFDLSTPQEKALGRLVKEKYGTDFYYMINYPLAVRPFYTMPNPEKPGFTNSYDFFMRGEEIVSGAQRIHEPEFLEQRAIACGVPPDTIRSYVDSFRLGAFPHAGVGVGLERVTMLFLGLNNIRKATMFPRDPKRLAP